MDASNVFSVKRRFSFGDVASLDSGQWGGNVAAGTDDRRKG
jgi:hypothetical protein